jgi:flagellar biosynthesis GTPase FlhF
VQTAASANVRLTADGDIRVKNLGELRKASNTSLEFVLGGDRNGGQSGDQGGAALQLTADGDITLRGIAARPPEAEFVFGGEFDEEMSRRAAAMGAQITREVETHVDALTRDLEEKFNRMAENEELSSRIQDKVAAAMRRAEEKLAEAMRKMEVRTQETDSRRRKGYGWQSPPPAPPPPAAPRKPQATDEERMMILRMVEQGKLTVDQAEKLLAAITGRKVER